MLVFLQFFYIELERAIIMKTIPESIAHLSQKWQLTDIRPLVKISATSNYVARAYSALYGCDVVLKILIADTKEPQALQLFNGNGYVKLLEYYQEYNGLLLENITPGNTLSTLFPHDDARSLEIMASLIKKMEHTDISGHEKEFPTVEQWMEELRTFESKRIPKDMLQKAYDLSQKLLSKKLPMHLLHGDLHHENIVQCAEDKLDRNSWVIIDPKGVLGTIEFEVIRFLMNPIPALLEQPSPKDIIERRIAQLHALFGFEKERLHDWLFVQAVLSACWAEEGGGDLFDYFMHIAVLQRS
jgi:streptomycin 6-kinase